MKMTSTLMAAAALACTIAACDGPKEKAGAARDEAAANASGVPYEGTALLSGLAGPQIVSIVPLRRRAIPRPTLEDQGRAIQAQADAEADKLEQQAQSIRDAAKAKAKELDQQAEKLKQAY
jgi:hypothetical protein